MARKHGSLAHAGKVRSRTPKVEKDTSKPKPLTGRAKRRMLYNKRFLKNAGLGKNKFGRRK